MPGVVLARIIYRNDSRRSLNRHRSVANSSGATDVIVAYPRIHPSPQRFLLSFIQEGELKPAGVSSTLTPVRW